MRNKRILFIYPNVTNTATIPKSISIFAGIAKKYSWDIGYFDTFSYDNNLDSDRDREKSGEFKFSKKSVELKSLNTLIPDLQDKIDTFKPAIIAISCLSIEYEFLMTFIRAINIPDKVITMIGGIHSILSPDEVINTKMFDLVCAGEGEEVIGDLLNNKKIDTIKNTYFRDRQSGAIIRNTRRNLLDENSLWENTPDYSFLDERYFLYPFDGKIRRRFRFECGRGCPFNCAYCGNPILRGTYKGLGMFIRTRPIKSIKKDMKNIMDRFNIELFYFEDECFFSHDIRWLKELSDWYGKEIRKPFIIQTRPETITEEKIKILKRMNDFFQISMGIESGSERILFEVCNRKTRVNDIIKTFDLLHGYNIKTCAFFMVGFPYETREDIFKSINLCRRIKPNVIAVSIFQPMPGQKLKEICLREGYINGKEPLISYTSHSVLKMPQLSSEEITNLRKLFILYATLPQKYYPQIKKCEQNYHQNKELHKKLVELRWKLGKSSPSSS